MLIIVFAITTSIFLGVDCVRLCKDEKSFGVEIPPAYSDLYFSGLTYACFDFRLMRNPVTFYRDDITAQACITAHNFNSPNRFRLLSNEEAEFFKALSEIAVEKNIDAYATFSLIKRRLLVKTGKMYCKKTTGVLFNDGPVYEADFEQFTGFYQPTTTPTIITTTDLNNDITTAADEVTIMSDDPATTTIKLLSASKLMSTLSSSINASTTTTTTTADSLDKHANTVKVKTVPIDDEKKEENKKKNGLTLLAVVAIGVSVVAALIFFLVMLCIYCKNNNNRRDLGYKVVFQK